RGSLPKHAQCLVGFGHQLVKRSKTGINRGFNDMLAVLCLGGRVSNKIRRDKPAVIFVINPEQSQNDAAGVKQLVVFPLVRFPQISRHFPWACRVDARHQHTLAELPPPSLSELKKQSGDASIYHYGKLYLGSAPLAGPSDFPFPNEELPI